MPQKETLLRPRSHPGHLVGKRTAQKDAIKDTTSDSKVSSCLHTDGQRLVSYFYLFILIYNKNNDN